MFARSSTQWIFRVPDRRKHYSDHYFSRTPAGSPAPCALNQLIPVYPIVSRAQRVAASDSGEPGRRSHEGSCLELRCAYVTIVNGSIVEVTELIALRCFLPHICRIAAPTARKICVQRCKRTFSTASAHHRCGGTRHLGPFGGAERTGFALVEFCAFLTQLRHGARSGSEAVGIRFLPHPSRRMLD